MITKPTTIKTIKLLLNTAFLIILQFHNAFAEDNKSTIENIINERIKNAEDNNYLSLSHENDLIGGGTDENYTSGVRISYFNTHASVPPVIDDIAKLIPTFNLSSTTGTFFSFGQNLYTPKNIKINQLQKNDRPYAAWLYGSVGLATVTKNHIDEMEFTLGIIGPQALGKQTQTFIHKNISNSPIPQGWKNQLKLEPGAILSWRRRWPASYASNVGDYRIRIEPDISVSLGNIYTYAGSGAIITFSPYNNRLQDTPPRVRPAMPGTGFFDTNDNKFNWQIFAGINGRAMARNIFLDGNSFRDNHSVDKKTFVSDANAGITFGYDDYRISYTLNYRTREFDKQKNPSIFGAINLTTRF